MSLVVEIYCDLCETCVIRHRIILEGDWRGKSNTINADMLRQLVKHLMHYLTIRIYREDTSNVPK